MKKIVMLSVLFLIVVSCSKSSNEEVATNTTPTELVGTWKFVGYFDDVATGVDDNNFHPVNDGFNIIFNTDGTCHTTANQDYNNGTYTVSNSSILTTNYIVTATSSTSTASEKICKLTTSELILEPVNAQLTWAYKYEKVTATSTISGKK
jgi:hypothetical protein